MALLTAAARHASALLRSTAAVAPLSSMRHRSCSSSSSSIRALRAKAASCRAEAASYRAEAASFRAKADSIRAANHDGELVRVIDSAIHSHNGNLAGEIPSEFPFEISKIEGLTMTDVTLTRCLKGEKIEVLVSMPRLDKDGDLQESSNSSSSSDETSSASDTDTSSSSDYYSSSSDDEASSSSDDSSSSSDETSSSSDNETSSSSDESSSSSEDEAENRTEEYNLPLTVTVSKPGGSSMEFACNAYPDEITIHTVSVSQPPSRVEEGDDAYDEGPDFSDLDKNLQEGLHKYLEVRGVTPNNIKLLHEYMVSKERQHYQVWLTKLWDFVRKD